MGESGGSKFESSELDDRLPGHVIKHSKNFGSVISSIGSTGRALEVLQALSHTKLRLRSAVAPQRVGNGIL